MSLIVNNANVATGMSPIVEAGLYADASFIDGISFSSRYSTGNAGQIQVEKYASLGGVAPSVPGANFVDREYTNEAIDINLNNSFKDSVKVPLYTQESIPGDTLMNKTLEVTQHVGTGRQQSALAALVGQGTTSDVTTAVTSSNVKSLILAEKAKIRKAHGNPQVVMCSVDTYTAILDSAGAAFTPMFNDDVIRTGHIGMWLGMWFIECNLLDGTTATYSYLDGNSASVTVDTSKTDFIVYDYNAFSLIDRLTALRTKDSEKFVGSLVQEEIDCGFKVTNADLVRIKKSV